MHRIKVITKISASGECGPPLFVLKGNKIPYKVLIKEGKEISKTTLTFLPRRVILVIKDDLSGVDA